MREIPNVWIAAVGLLALFTAVESYFVLTRILIDMRRLFSLQRQKIYLAVLVNVAIFLFLNGGIMLYFAIKKAPLSVLLFLLVSVLAWVYRENRYTQPGIGDLR